MSQDLSLIKEKATCTLSIDSTSPNSSEKPSSPQSEETLKVAKAALRYPRQRRKDKMSLTGDITKDVKNKITQKSKTQRQASQKKIVFTSLGSRKLILSEPILPVFSESALLIDSDDEKIKRKKNFELIPRDFKYQNFSTPELTKLQSSNIAKFETDSFYFIAAVRTLYSPNQVVTDQQINEINARHKDMLNSAASIVSLVQARQSITSGKPKDIKIDFLHDLRQILEKSFFLAKIEHLLKNANNDLKELLTINFKCCRHDNRIKMFIPEFDSEIEKAKNSELEKKKKEIKILHRYREVMLELAKNLERIGKSYKLPENEEFSHVQEKILKQVETILSKTFQILKKYDKDENELGRILERNSNESYKSIVYSSIVEVIKTQIIEIFWITANKQAQMTLIQLHSEELRTANKRYTLFCSDCLNEFNESLNHQKYDAEFLLGWRRMVGAASVIYIDKERNVLLEPRKIPEPDNPDDVEKMKQYYKELDEYGKDCISLLSTYAFFDDATFLDNFLKNAFQLSQKFIPSPPTNDPLEVHARIFNVLENLLSPLSENKKILSEFNKTLSLTNKETILRLEQKAKSNGQERLGVEMILQFMLQFYRALNHKYIMEPISNLEEIYKLVHSPKISIIKKEVKMLPIIGTEIKEVLQPARCIYIVLGDANFEVHSVRVDEIDPGAGIDETYCYIYTCTAIRKAYPGELASYPHSIEFSYQRVNPQTSKQSPEEIKNIESAIDEKIRLLGLLIDAAGFPNFVERYVE